MHYCTKKIQRIESRSRINIHGVVTINKTKKQKYSYTSAFCHFTSFADLSEIKIDRWQSNRIVLVSGKLMCFALKFQSEIALI